MLPSVSVPVLSVNRSVMLPRSSMLTSRFTSTLRCARRRDPVERLTVTIAGRSCGVSPIAIASEKSSASMKGRCSNRLITKIETVSTPATRTRRYENFFSPTWNAVSECRSPRPTAIAPNCVPDPVRTTTPTAEPSLTIVPMSPHDATPSVDRRDPLLDRHRLARQHGFVALELGDLEQAHVGRDDVADPQADDVAGNELHDVDRSGRSVPGHRARSGGSASAAPRPPSRTGTR